MLLNHRLVEHQKHSIINIHSNHADLSQTYTDVITIYISTCYNLTVTCYKIGIVLHHITVLVRLQTIKQFLFIFFPQIVRIENLLLSSKHSYIYKRKPFYDKNNYLWWSKSLNLCTYPQLDSPTHVLDR